jgi:hypothetical protein
MKAKATKMPEKTDLAIAPRTPRNTDDDTGTALHGLAKEVSGVAEELRTLYHIESLSDHVGELASALHNLANATAMSVIAKSGTDEDRAVAVAYLKRWFEDFRE